MNYSSNISNERALMCRSLNWQICQKMERAIWTSPEINIDIRWSKNRFSAEPLVLCLQNGRMPNVKMAFEFLQFICNNSRLITKLSINVQVSDDRIVNSLLKLIINAKNIHLEEINIRRRYVGQQFSSIIELIKLHSKTLCVLGKIGLSEAVLAFDENLHLERCSLINFDLIENGQMESADLTNNTRSCIRRLSGLGCTFNHLSLTAYSGIQISKNPELYFLKACKVSSLRLTMQKTDAIPAPNYLRPLLRGLRRIELVGQMILDPQLNLELLFPDLEYFSFEYLDLATGLNLINQNLNENRKRVLSEADTEIELEFENDMQECSNFDTTSQLAAAC